MRSAVIAAAAALCLGAAVQASAQDVRSLASGAQPARANLADLKGLVGDWAGKDAEAGFSKPEGGEIVGHLALFNDKGPRVQEMWIFRPDGNSVTLHQKHYDPQLTDREGAGKWGERKLLAVDRKGIYLDNLTWETKGDTLDLYVRIPGRNGAAPTMLSYSLKRVK